MNTIILANPCPPMRDIWPIPALSSHTSRVATYTFRLQVFTAYDDAKQYAYLTYLIYRTYM